MILNRKFRARRIESSAKCFESKKYTPFVSKVGRKAVFLSNILRHNSKLTIPSFR